MQLMISLKEVITFGVVALLVVCACVAALVRWGRQLLCEHHQGYFENRECHAICRSCGKDLGFVGTLTGRPNEDRDM